MDFFSIIIGLLIGLFLRTFTTLINIRFSEKSDDNKLLKESEYNLYLKLNDLYNWYFWLATNELHKKETKPEIIESIHKVAIELAQQLHQNESSEFTKELLKILYDESYESYNARWKHMSELSEKMGQKVSPIHRTYLKTLSDNNLNLMEKPSFSSKAPASPIFRMGL